MLHGLKGIYVGQRRYRVLVAAAEDAAGGGGRLAAGDGEQQDEKRRKKKTTMTMTSTAPLLQGITDDGELPSSSVH